MSTDPSQAHASQAHASQAHASQAHATQAHTEEKPELSPEAVRGALEALLLVAAEPLTPRRVATLVGLTEAQARAYLRLLAEEHEKRGGGLAVIEIAGGFRLVSRPEYDEYVTRLEPARSPMPLSPAAVETLAIISYRQPVTRADIEAVRGVRCEGVIGTLLDRALIEEVGRAEGPGRPILYGTTRRFLERFGLRDLSELPPLPQPAPEDSPEA